MILPEDPLDDRTLEDVATALHHAINNGHVDTALVLIDAGLTWNSRMHRGGLQES